MLPEADAETKIQVKIFGGRSGEEGSETGRKEVNGGTWCFTEQVTW